MGKFEDLTGRRFGYWTVIEKDPNRRFAWICRCDCGTTKSQLASALKSGHTKSCGCKKSELQHNANAEDLTSQRFGRLTVIEYAGHRGKSKANAWKCICDCGNVCVTTSRSLKSGHTKSCGCYHSDKASQANLIDLVGMRFERLTVIERAPSNSKKAYWLCFCDCGNKKIVCGDSLVRGSVKSCGCLHREQAAIQGKNNTIHGGSRRTEPKERLFRIWGNMRDRCRREKCPAYKNYGGRGISICEEWNDYSVFRDWAYSHGYSDSLSIDRIDVNGNYEPSNCRWVTAKEQANNTRRSRYITYNGYTKTMAAWAEEVGISYSTLNGRICRGWTVERALTEPLRENNRRG